MNILQSQNPKIRVAVLGTMLLLPAVGLGAWYWMATRSDEDQLTRIVQDYGYSAVTPPSRLFGPGTITTVERLSNGTIQLHLACKMDDNALAAMWHKSPTINRSLVSAVKQTFKSTAKAMEIVASGATGKRVEGTDVSLRNINIVTMTYKDLIDVRSQYLKGTCEEVVIWNLSGRRLGVPAGGSPRSRPRLQAGYSKRTRRQRQGRGDRGRRLGQCRPRDV